MAKTERMREIYYKRLQHRPFLRWRSIADKGYVRSIHLEVLLLHAVSNPHQSVTSMNLYACWVSWVHAVGVIGLVKQGYR